MCVELIIILSANKKLERLWSRAVQAMERLWSRAVQHKSGNACLRRRVQGVDGHDGRLRCGVPVGLRQPRRHDAAQQRLVGRVQGRCVPACRAARRQARSFRRPMAAVMLSVSCLLTSLCMHMIPDERCAMSAHACPAAMQTAARCVRDRAGGKAARMLTHPTVTAGASRCRAVQAWRQTRASFTDRLKPTCGSHTC